MYGLNIHLISFTLEKNLISPSDKVRVSITTIPEENKQSFIIEANKMNYVHHFFTVNITDQTKKIIFVFRKKSFIQSDPIIASTVIHANEFPKSLNDQANTEIKTINIYESMAQINNFGYKYPYDSRRVFGQMQVQLVLTEAFPTKAFTSGGRGKVQNGSKYGNVNSNKYNSKANDNNDENLYQNDIIFVDNGVYN